jgi:hypothetical protein
MGGQQVEEERFVRKFIEEMRRPRLLQDMRL